MKGLEAAPASGLFCLQMASTDAPEDIGCMTEGAKIAKIMKFLIDYGKVFHYSIAESYNFRSSFGTKAKSSKDDDAKPWVFLPARAGKRSPGCSRNNVVAAFCLSTLLSA